ncbi:hypothetical protein J2S74_003490 [Evansella vedderi]|uniref:Spore coat protein n=1 Tax=Evansella vedderi TaxID=38282 RepID=A0ABT9ZZF5_9BACI|nr:hypothetical protein [Evansella vedderi]MDQ0256091.1 hypothetical protein [Evansella vedderi]
MKDQNKLMDLYLDRLFKKYNISPDKVNLTPDQKVKVKSIVENIQKDVQKFLENTEKKITEHDMPKKQKGVEGNEPLNLEHLSDEENSLAHRKPEPPTTKPKVYLQGKKRKRKKRR